MNKRIRKKKLLKDLNKEERYNRTHCRVCDRKVGLFKNYFNKYGFCSIDCGYELYGLSRQ